MDVSHFSRTIVRTTAALLTAAGLLAGLGAHGAAADGAPSAPRLRSVEATSPTKIMVRWDDTSETEDGFRINFYQNGSFGGYINSYTKVAGHGGLGVFEVYALQPNTAYCIGVKAYTGTGDNGASMFSPESTRLCATTLPTPAAPDLTVTRISGPQQLFAGVSSVYEVVVANLGGATTTGYVNIRAEDGLELVGTASVPAGFDCATTTTRYQGPFLRCTGMLAGTESHISNRVAVFQVRVRATGAGTGALSAYAGATTDADGSNAERSLSVTVK
jgi:hypothetical protein